MSSAFAREARLRTTTRPDRHGEFCALLRVANSPSEVADWQGAVSRWLTEYEKHDPEGAAELADAIVKTFQGHQRRLDTLPPPSPTRGDQ